MEKVKQIVGGSLTDQGNQAKENFTASENADYYAKNVSERRTYRGTCDTFKSVSSEYYRETKAQAIILALWAISKKDFRWAAESHAENAEEFWEAGANHVIVTSYVFPRRKINWENMENLNMQGERKCCH